MNIVNYSTSGLGNRLRPLASCYAVAKQTGRKLLAYWDIITPNGCLAKWDELFENDLEVISLEQLKELKDCVLFTEKARPGNLMCHGYEREYHKFGRDALKKLAEQYHACQTQDFNCSYNNENIIVYENNFLNNTNLADAHDFLRNLRPIESIASRIDAFANELGLNKEVIGIHARGTDSGNNINAYLSQIQHHLSINPKQKFFIATEDPDFEEVITSKFPSVLFRKKQHYIRRINNNDSWDNCNGFYITKEHAQEAIEDLYLLAKTNIGVHSGSSFGELARILS